MTPYTTLLTFCSTVFISSISIKNCMLRVWSGRCDRLCRATGWASAYLLFSPRGHCHSEKNRESKACRSRPRWVRCTLTVGACTTPIRTSCDSCALKTSFFPRLDCPVMTLERAPWGGDSKPSTPKPKARKSKCIQLLANHVALSLQCIAWK